MWTMDENLKELKLGDTFDNGSLYKTKHRAEMAETETSKQNKITARIRQTDTREKML